MAGLGFKDFAVGEVLTSADVDGYLMQQTVMRFADAGARGSALGTAVGTGVPLAEGMVAYLDDVNQVQVYDGTIWKPTGSVLQVVSTAKTDGYTTTSSSLVAVTGLDVTITPSSATNRVLLLVQIMATNVTGSADVIQLTRGGTNIFTSTAGSTVNATYATQLAQIVSLNSALVPATFVFLDSPSTTSATTYDVRVSVTAGTLKINESNNGNNGATSSITAIEVAG